MNPLTIDTPLTRAALEIATLAHAYQTRHGGEPYITHPVAVANRAVELIRIEREGKHSVRELELVTVVGVAHDAPEDVEGFTNATLLNPLVKGSLLDISEASSIDSALNRLNKHRFPTYCALIVAAKGIWLSRYVKRADLWHNLQTAKPHNREKYLLAQYILEQP